MSKEEGRMAHALDTLTERVNKTNDNLISLKQEFKDYTASQDKIAEVIEKAKIELQKVSDENTAKLEKKVKEDKEANDKKVENDRKEMEAKQNRNNLKMYFIFGVIGIALTVITIILPHK